MFKQGTNLVVVALSTISIMLSSALVNTGCGLGFGGGTWDCGTDADPEHYPSCYEDAGAGISPQSLTCADNGGECVDVGTGRFKDKAVLLWIGDELDAPECPERAPVQDFTGYGDFVNDVQCAECECSAPTCILPNAIGIDTQDLCMSGITDNYAAPKEWDGSCYSAGVIPAGSFSSFALPPATVSACIPSAAKPVGAPTAMATRSNIVLGGVGFKTYAKACKKDVLGNCADGTKICVQNANPPPPQFQYCVMYTLPVDDTKLPECPDAFPERHLFYADIEGKRECASCQCGEPVGSQCVARFSAFQDPACGDVPSPFFKELAGDLCIPAMPWSLGAISAEMAVNLPGYCEPSGGGPVGEVKPIDPSVFCCQPLDN